MKHWYHQFWILSAECRPWHRKYETKAGAPPVTPRSIPIFSFITFLHCQTANTSQQETSLWLPVSKAHHRLKTVERSCCPSHGPHDPDNGYVRFSEKKRATSININEQKWIMSAGLTGGDSLTGAINTDWARCSPCSCWHILCYNGLPKNNHHLREHHVTVFWS